MAGNSNDKCIGKLYLDTSQIKQDVKEVQELLKSIGAGVKVDLSKNVAKEVKAQLEEVRKEIEKQTEKIKNAAEKVTQSFDKIGSKTIKNEAVKQMTADLKQYYDYLTKAENARSSGNKQTAAYWDEQANAIRKAAEAAMENEQAVKAATKAEERYEAAKRKSADVANKQTDTAAKKEAQEVERATQAYIRMLEAKNKLKELEAKGMADSAEYKKAAEAAGKASDAFNKYSKEVRDLAKASTEAKNVQRDLKGVVDATAESTSANKILTDVKQKYFELTDAIKNYQAAMKINDTDSMSMYQAKISAIMQEVAGIQQAVQASEMEAGTKQQILNLIQQCTTAEHQHATAIQSSVNSTQEMDSMMTGVLTRMFSLMAIIRTVSSLIKNTVEYVSQYYDKMNEIQMITGKTNEEVERLGETYRDIAESMSVSSLDMADAAIYFTRQGLGAAEIERRLKNTTMYAKAANIEFRDAAELITAVVNSMRLYEQEAIDGRNATQRVADVFLAVGDNAATSGEEIGRAMQKAAASAGTFGVSFEWLAAYIASVSETTRQEARTIGTALNTIIARLHSIRTSGYNSEDETKINDVAKALHTIGVELMDQNGEWRDMTDIFNDVAAVWDKLDGKTKSYIATTMAGVKQQNVFLALMNDLAKGVDGGSRAWQLYEIAMNSAGTASEKYSVYTDSVTASQERLNVAQEKFYALLDANVIKDWNNALAGFITNITVGAEKTHGLTIILPVVIGLFTTLAIVIARAGTASALFAKIWESHPVLLAITAGIVVITALISALSAGAAGMASAADRYDKASERFTQSSERLNNMLAVQREAGEVFGELGKKADVTKKDLENYSGQLERISSLSPECKAAIDDLSNGLATQEETVERLNTEFERLITNERNYMAAQLISKYGNWSPARDSEGNHTLIDYYGRNQQKYIEQYGDNDRAFEEWLKRAYQVQKGGKTANTMPEDVFNEITGLLDEGQDWGYIGSTIWYSFIGTGGSKSFGESIREEADNMIDEALNAFSTTMDSTELGVMREHLTNLIMGEDGVLSYDEYKNAGKIISSYMTNLLDNGFDLAEVDPSAVLNYVGKNLFGEYFSIIFKDQIAEAANDKELIAAIGDAYNELLLAGFSNEQIADLLRNTKIEDWDKAIDLMEDKLMESLREKFGRNGSLGERIQSVMLNDDGTETTTEEYLEYFWGDLDIATLKLIDDLATAGVSLDDINNAMADSESVEEFTERLHEMAQEAGLVEEDIDEAEQSIANLAKTVKTSISDIEKIDEALKSLRDDGEIKFSDLLDLTSAHPEILAVIHDSEKLRETLENIKASEKDNIWQSIHDMLLNDVEVMKNSPFAEFFDESNGVTTLQEYMKSIKDDPEALQRVNDYLALTADQFIAIAGGIDMIDTQKLEEFQTLLLGGNAGNVDLNARPTIDASKLTEAGWGNQEPGIATVYSMSYTAGTKDRLAKEGRTDSALAWNMDVVIGVTPILPNGEVLSPDSLNDYMDYLLANSGDINELIENDKVENGGMGLVINVDAVAEDETFEHAEERVGRLHDLIHQIQELLYGEKPSEKSWLEEQAEAAIEAADLEWAKSNKYSEQVSQMQGAFATGGMEEALAVWDSFSTEMQDAIRKEYPNLIIAMANAEKQTKNNTKGTEAYTEAERLLNKELKSTSSYANATHFTKVNDSIKKLTDGTISATEAYDTFYDEVNKLTKAEEDINFGNQQLANGLELTASDVSNLSDVLGISADQILADWPSAVQMFEDLIAEGGDLEDMFNRLNEAAFLRITGTSTADFSELQNGIISTTNMTEEMLRLLEATGQWTVETVPLDGLAWVMENGQWVQRQMQGMQQILKPTGNNPYKRTTSTGSHRSSNRTGGGGGGGSDRSNDSSSSGMTEVERALDRMDQLHAIQESQQSYYQSQSKYHEQAGLLQGVIGYSEKEIGVLQAQNQVLESNIKTIENYIAAKKKELDGMTVTDDKYEEVRDDLDKLQKAHQKYTKELVDNRTEIDKLNETIKDQQDKIRDMEINIRNTILKAIEDREKKAKNMLQNEISMENTILDLIKKRYEAERDLILDNTESKISALQEERDLLAEQLRIRKEMAEEEDKAAQLANLEAQYQRIVADPTRAKEARKIMDQINDLREEMAWDKAEKEVEAQQDSIDQQITSLEDYKQYVEEYYEDLFKHPQKLIEEMEELITKSDATIIEWLKKNNEDYQASTENTQKTMVDTWQETLDNMHGKIKTYWDEVEEIIAQGDDYIIQFLIDNSEDYAKAGKQQAEKYVDGWREQLDNLHKALQNVFTVDASSYIVMDQGPSGNSNSSNSSRSSGYNNGSKGGNPGDTTVTEDHGYQFKYGGITYSDSGYASKAKAQTAMEAAVESIVRKTAGNNASSSAIGQAIREIVKNATVYKQGGLAFNTGLAWLDGTQNAPERVLSPYQTQLFETMVQALDRMSRVSVPAMPSVGDVTAGGNTISVGDIVVNVDNLDTDDDYEELAAKVGEVLLEQIGRTTVVGGLRINPM